MKKKIFSSIAFLLILIIMVSCVSKQDYEKVQSNLATAQSQVGTLQSDYDSLKSDYNSLKNDCDALQSVFDETKSDLDAAKAQVENLQSDVEAAQSQIETVQQKVSQAQAQMEVLTAIFIPTLTGEIVTWTGGEAVAYFIEWDAKIEATEDSILEEKFQALMDSSFGDEQMTDFFIYLLESIPKTLE